MSQLRWFVSIIIDSLCLTWLQVCWLFLHSPMAFLLCLISLPPQLLSTDFKWLGLNSLMVGWSLVELHWSCAAGDPLTLLPDHHPNPTNSESLHLITVDIFNEQRWQTNIWSVSGNKVFLVKRWKAVRDNIWLSAQVSIVTTSSLPLLSILSLHCTLWQLWIRWFRPWSTLTGKICWLPPSCGWSLALGRDNMPWRLFWIQD